MLGKGERTRKAFTLAFASPEIRKVFDELARPFDDAFKGARERGASTREATDDALRAYDAQLARFAKSNMSWTKIQDQAVSRAKNDPALKFRDAQERLLKAFTSEEMLTAIEKLAKHFPVIADVLGRIVGFAVENPYLAGGALLGGKIGGGAMASMVGNIGTQAASGFGRAAKSGGTKMSAAFAEAVKKQGFGSIAVKSIAVAGGITTAAAVGVGVGMALGEEVGDDFDASSKAANWLIPAIGDSQFALERNDKQGMRESVAALENALRKADQFRSKEEHFLGLTTGDLAMGLFGPIAPIAFGLKRMGEDNISRESDAREMLALVKARLAEQEKSGADAAKAVADLAESSRDASRALSGVRVPGTPGKAGHGLRQPAPVVPIGPKI